MAHKSFVLMVALVFGVLFSILYVSSEIHTNAEIITRPKLSRADAMNIAIADLRKQVAPLHLDRYVEAQWYFGSSMNMLFVHENGTLFGVNDNYTTFLPCEGPNCRYGDGNDPFRGHLFYDVNGSWQDSSIGNCSPYSYAIDAQTGAILWSRVGDSNAVRCDVRPPSWK